MKTGNLNALIKLAQGDRSQNEFALHCNISSATLTLIQNGKRNPSPKILKKIADRSYNGVTYEELMIAAGFIPESFSKNAKKEKTNTDVSNTFFETLYSSLTDDEREMTVGYMKRLLERRGVNIDKLRA